MTWRDHAAPIIAEVIRNQVGDARPPYSPEQIKSIKKELLEAYPFGERQYHPYKIWLDEIKRQLRIRVQKREPESSLQITLFPS